MLGVHKGHLAALFLGLRRHMEGQGRSYRRTLARRSPRCALGAGRPRPAPRPGTSEPVGITSTCKLFWSAKAHNGTLAVHFLDLAHSGLNGPLLVLRRRGGGHAALSLLPYVLPPNSDVLSGCPVRAFLLAVNPAAKGSEHHPGNVVVVLHHLDVPKALGAHDAAAHASAWPMPTSKYSRPPGSQGRLPLLADGLVEIQTVLAAVQGQVRARNPLRSGPAPECRRGEYRVDC